MNDDVKMLLERYEPKPTKPVETTRQMCTARYSPCGRFLVAGGFDALVHRWDVSAAEVKVLPTLAGHNGWVDEVAFDPAGEFFVTADTWGQLRCWKSGIDAEPVWSIAEAHDGWIQDLAISPDGSLIATCGNDHAVRVWSAADGAKRHELSGHGTEVFSVAFHPDGQSLVSGDLKGSVRQWNLATGECSRQLDASVLYTEHRLQEVGGARKLHFSRDGRLLTCAGTKPANGGNVQGIPTVLLFDWESGELKRTFELGKTGDVYVSDVAFHPDGFLMLTISGNPGTGKLVYHRLEDEKPFFETTRVPNAHSLSLHPYGGRLAVVTTNSGSNGNGRRVDKDGNYIGNHSPIVLLDMPPRPATPPAGNA